MNASCVIKLGGSLLDLPDLPRRLKSFLSDFSRPRPVLVAGGGELVEQIRKWDRAYALGEEPSHWIALRALTISALAMERILEDVEHVETIEALQVAWHRGKVPLFDAYRFILDVDERSHDPLPRRWRVTTDSIAARMATTLGAPELILLKSVTPDEGLSIADAARRGIVDPHFPQAARGIQRVVVVNLREDDPKEIVLEPEGEESPSRQG